MVVLKNFKLKNQNQKDSIILIVIYSLINCFSFSASIPAITNKINPGIPKKVAVANTNIPQISKDIPNILVFFM
jgi:hypothetical protein